jgi:hypothetical protein
MISSLAEHAWKCLKVDYLDRIKYDFQKSRVTGPWDHKKVSVSTKKSKNKFHACGTLSKYLVEISGRKKRFQSHNYVKLTLSKVFVILEI